LEFAMPITSVIQTGAGRSTRKMQGGGDDFRKMQGGEMRRMQGGERFAGLADIGADWRVGGCFGPSPLRGLGSFFDDAVNEGSKVIGGAKDEATKAAQQAEADAKKRAQDAVNNAFPDPATLIKSIKFETTHFPPMEIVDPLKPTPPGVGSELTRSLKPRITMSFAPVFGQQVKPVVYAPYGDPGSSDWETWATLGVAVAAVGGGIALLGVLSFFKGRKGGLLRRYLARRAEKKAAAKAMTPFAGLGPRGKKALKFGGIAAGAYLAVGAYKSYKIGAKWKANGATTTPSLREYAGWTVGWPLIGAFSK
jgi:hypothetical protein